MKHKRIFHHYSKLEEFSGNMWKQVEPYLRDSYVQKSRDLMLDCAAFRAAMVRAVNEWPNSCEATLTASTMNHQAWMGHAGCAINHDAPEDLTRLAWRTLTQDQQDEANLAADDAIAYWADKYSEGNNNA